jgi:hypothetical protein
MGNSFLPDCHNILMALGAEFRLPGNKIVLVDRTMGTVTCNTFQGIHRLVLDRH